VAQACSGQGRWYQNGRAGGLERLPHMCPNSSALQPMGHKTRRREHSILSDPRCDRRGGLEGLLHPTIPGYRLIRDWRSVGCARRLHWQSGVDGTMRASPSDSSLDTTSLPPNSSTTVTDIARAAPIKLAAATCQCPHYPDGGDSPHFAAFVLLERRRC
jgi:hypothetical protein